MKKWFTKYRKLPQKLTLYAIIVVFSLTSLSAPANAQDPCNEERLKELQVSILNCYGNSNACSVPGGESSIGITPLRGADNQEKMWNFFLEKGLTAIQAAGVMGNIQTESASTWSPVVFQTQKDPWDVRTGFHNAFGIAQWDGGRRYTPEYGGVLGALKKNYPELTEYIHPSYDPRRSPKKELPPGVEDQLLSFELNYLHNESKSRPVTYRDKGKAENEWETLRLQQTIENAVVFWHHNFEISAQSEEDVIRIRGGHAQAIFDRFNGAETDATANCGGDTSGFTGTVLAYAWPKYKSVPAGAEADDPKPHPGVRGIRNAIRKKEYVTAVTAAQKNGIYTGGFDGVDCGAFVTLLMLNSGFEPKYNFEGKYSKGAGNVAGGQIPWLEKNWNRVGRGNQIKTSQLRPGDVAVSPTHTFVWVGEIEGFGGKSASASYGDRAPMADGGQSPTDSNFTWYSKYEQ